MILAALLTAAAYIAFVLIAKGLIVDTWPHPLDEPGDTP